MKNIIYNFKNKHNFKIHGRTDISDKNGLVLLWSNSGFSFNFRGNGFILDFDDVRDETPYIRIFTENFSQRFCVPQKNGRVIIEGLGEGEHTVKILKITEGKSFEISNLTLTGEEPMLLPPPEDKKLKIEFYGDSITCGYGVLGPNDGVGFKMHEEDSTRAYAFMTSEMLDADITTICISGKGIVSDCTGARSGIEINKFFKWRMNQNDIWDFKNWIPDIVVINAGTNDAWGQVKDDEFIEAGLKFLADLRKYYNDVPIIWVYGIMDETKLNAVEKIVKKFNEINGKTYFLYIPKMIGNLSETGGGGHPGINLSKRASAVLADFIKKILN